MHDAREPVLIYQHHAVTQGDSSQRGAYRG